jgi:hypothetical protein
MPYLTCIGGHGAAGRTKTGAGARGYWIFRRGTSVYVRYGAVETGRDPSVRVHWLWWRKEQPRNFKTVPAAKAWMKQMLVKRKYHGYTPLKPRVKIHW